MKERTRNLAAELRRPLTENRYGWRYF